MSLTEYVALLRRNWLAIVSLAVLGAVAGAAFAFASTPVYRAQTSTLVTTDVGTNANELLQGSTYAESLVASYVRLVGSEAVLQPVIDEEGLDVTSRQLSRRVSAESPLNTLVIDIAVTGTDPAETARVADAVTSSLADTVRDVSPQVDGTPSIRLTIVESAAVPLVPVAPNTRLLALAGLTAGLVLGVAIALLRFVLGTPFRVPEDVSRVVDAPVLGSIVEARRDTRLSAAVIENPMGPEAESVRRLVANLGFVAVGGGVRSIVVTSASPAESKSSVASALALVLTEASRRVLLVDADLRAPTLHVVTNLDNTLGLSTVLIGEDTLEVAAQAWGRHAGLDVLTSGPTPPNPGQLLRSDAMEKFLHQAEQTYDYVVIDTPPLGAVVDAALVAQHASGALVVARRGKTKPRLLARALDAMATANVTVLGVVMTRMPRPPRSAYGYGYGKRTRGSRRRSRGSA